MYLSVSFKQNELWLIFTIQILGPTPEELEEMRRQEEEARLKKEEEERQERERREAEESSLRKQRQEEWVYSFRTSLHNVMKLKLSFFGKEI